jgi:hypothetical protein
MKITLVDGTYESQEAIDLMTYLVHAKIKFHESKIRDLDEMDVKMREKSIKQLQQDLYQFRELVAKGRQEVELHAELNVELRCLSASETQG